MVSAMDPGVQSSGRGEALQVNAIVMLASSVAWVVAFKAHEALWPFAPHAAGIDLIFIPSGIRFFAILIGGLWAAIGVALGSLLLAGGEFNISDLLEIGAISACSGFAPYVSLLASQRIARINRNLANLFPRHLPTLAFGTAVGSALIHNLLFWGFGFEGVGSLLPDSLAMAAGDFVGSLIVVILVVGVMQLYRRWR